MENEEVQEILKAEHLKMQAIKWAKIAGKVALVTLAAIGAFTVVSATLGYAEAKLDSGEIQALEESNAGG